MGSGTGAGAAAFEVLALFSTAGLASAIGGFTSAGAGATGAGGGANSAGAGAT